MKYLFLSIIRLYQKIFSFDHGWLKRFFPYGYCRFYPTCSEYTYQAIERYGAWRGGFKGLKRLVHCHPWHPGGHDPVN